MTDSTESRQTPDRILVATDFSAHATAALQQAVWLSQKSGSSVTLVHVIPDFSMSVHWGPQEREMNQQTLYDRSETALQQTIDELKGSGSEATSQTLVGEPYVEITHAVQKDGYSMVMVGTRGRSKWEQFFVGSNAKRLIRKCPSSVWIVRADQPVEPEVVVAATDFSDVSFRAVREGLRIAQLAGAEFHLLHCVDSTDVPDDLISHIPEGSSLREEINQAAMLRLQEFLDSLNVDRTSIRTHLAWGTPWQEIQQLSQRTKADLIVIGTVGRSGIRGLLLGNTAEKVLDTSLCSILTVKPDNFVSPLEPEQT